MGVDILKFFSIFFPLVLLFFSHFLYLYFYFLFSYLPLTVLEVKIHFIILAAPLHILAYIHNLIKSEVNILIVYLNYTRPLNNLLFIDLCVH